jgi:thiamine biosynthesis protein ThiI
MMYRKAERIAADNGCGAVVTGEILGEQASQTFRNLILDTPVIKIPIIRPLIGMNKREVVDIGRTIGTYEISATKAQGCSAAAIKARTHAKWGEIETEESGLPIDELVEEGIRGLKRAGNERD